MNIFSLPIIEIAISIIISWALFSIFCSIIHEAVVQFKSERGKFFRQQLLRQLFDTPNQINWASLLYTHSSIDLLSRSYNKPASDISPKIFAEALIETVANAHIVQSKKNESNNSDIIYKPKYQNQLLNDFSFATKVLLPSDVVSLLKSSITKAEIRADQGNYYILEERTRRGYEAYNENKVYDFLIEEISQWYNQLSNRTTIWYKKKSKQRLFALGLLLSVLLNIDSIKLFKYYNSNPEARTEVINFYESNETTLSKLADKYDKTDTTTTFLEIKNLIQTDKKQVDSLIKATGIPIGWNFSSVKNAETKNTFDVIISKVTGLLLKIIGFIITAFAASLGAPFWFDILKKANPLKKQ